MPAEELVAELTSAFLCAQLGIQDLREHASYLGDWVTLMKGDKTAIVTAASQAQKAADYLNGLQPSEQMQDTTTPTIHAVAAE